MSTAKARGLQLASRNEVLNGNLYFYRAKILNVVDGDTIDVMLDQGFRTYRKERIRLLGVDAPETRTLNLEEKIRGEKVKSLVEDKIKEHNHECYISTWAQDSFGRWLGECYFDFNTSTKSLNKFVKGWSENV